MTMQGGKGASEEGRHCIVFADFLFIILMLTDRHSAPHTHTNTNTQTICDVALNMKCCGFCGMFYIFLEIVFRFHMSPASLDNNTVWGVAAPF